MQISNQRGTPGASSRSEEELAEWRTAGYRPDLAWSLCDYGGIVEGRGRPGDREKAATPLDEPLDT